MKRKNYLFIAAIISYLSIHAQSMDKKMKDHLKEVEKSKEKGTVIWDMDTVYKAGIPYCIITEKSNGFLQISDYSVKSLSGQELIYVKADFYITNPGHPAGVADQRVNYYTFLFMDTQNKAEIGYPRKIYKEVVEDDMISNGSVLNSDAENKFISLNGTKYSAAAATYQQPQQVVVVQQGTVNGAATTDMIERDRTGMIQIMNGYIMQSNITIGTATQNQVAQNGDITKTIDIYYTNGAKVAEATCIGINNHSWSVVTTKDNQVRIINSSFNNDAMDIIKFLIADYYL